MRSIFLLLCSIVALIAPLSSVAQNVTEIENRVKQHIILIYDEGKTEIQIPFYTYHFPFAYDRDVYDQLNRWPLGFGIGKGLDEPNGKWSGFYFLTFSDSHHDQEPGLIYSQTWPLIGDKHRNISAGYVAFITARSDIRSYLPFPGILPAMSASLAESFKITFSYVPSFTHGTGNVTLFTATYRY